MANNNTFKVDTKTIALTATTNANTLDAITTAIMPANIDKDTFTSAVWTAIKKEVKTLHIKNYTNKTLDEIVANAVYHVTYGGDEKTVVIPLVDFLQGDTKNEYNNKANMLQTATAKFINTDYETSQQRSKARSKTEKDYAAILQWAFDFLTADRKDGVKVYVNNKDVDIISGMLLKLRKDKKGEKICTTGERTIQAYIEYAFRQKIAGKPFFVELYSTHKDQNGVKPFSANDGKKPEETKLENKVETSENAAE